MVGVDSMLKYEVMGYLVISGVMATGKMVYIVDGVTVNFRRVAS